MMDEKQIEEKAGIAQVIATAEAVARAESPDVMTIPPDGLPALTSIRTLVVSVSFR